MRAQESDPGAPVRLTGRAFHDDWARYDHTKGDALDLEIADLYREQEKEQQMNKALTDATIPSVIKELERRLKPAFTGTNFADRAIECLEECEREIKRLRSELAKLDAKGTRDPFDLFADLITEGKQE